MSATPANFPVHISYTSNTSNPSSLTRSIPLSAHTTITPNFRNPLLTTSLAQRDDLLSIEAIRHQCKADLPALPTAAISAAIDSGTAIIARLEAVTIAFATWHQPPPTAAPIAVILQLATDPRYRHLGAAHALISHLAAQLALHDITAIRPALPLHRRLRQHLLSTLIALRPTTQAHPTATTPTQRPHRASHHANTTDTSAPDHR